MYQRRALWLQHWSTMSFAQAEQSLWLAARALQHHGN